MHPGTGCFHCGEPLTGREPWTVRLDGEDRPVCCPGCKAVAEFIRDTGLSDYYDYRTAPALRPEGAGDPDAQWAAFDQPELLEQVTSTCGDGQRESSLLVEGVRCAACGWLIEKSLARVPGVVEARVNPATARARLVWEPGRVSFSHLLGALSRLGYRPHPGGGASAAVAETEKRQALRRLGVAGLGMMQVMMFAVALYAGAFEGMDPALEAFLRLVSMAVATPVVLYSGFPFFTGAWRDLRAGRPGMDVPVALAIGGAWVASVLHVLTGAGEVYFDSVTMFVFFLSLGRFLEMGARHRAGDTRDSLARLLPTLARRRGAAGDWEDVVPSALVTGDTVLVRHGETVPADGRLSDDGGRFDESMLTGESRAIPRGTGETAVAGSINLGEPVSLVVERTGADLLVSSITRLLERAQAERPPVALAADRVARWFVTGVLAAAALVYAWWSHVDPGRAFEVTLAVLVVTCPCALSLATPAAITAATNFLARHGLLVTRAGALERLARADRAVFDKTGTLTRGRAHICAVELTGRLDREAALGVGAALEAASEHPLARAFRDIEPAGDARVTIHPGEGLEGVVGAKRYRLGRPAFAAGLSPVRAPEVAGGTTAVFLGDADGIQAVFRIADEPRPGVAGDLDRLKDLGLGLEIASGDSPDAVAAVAGEAGIVEWRSGMSPSDKLERIRALQGEGHTVVMVGDGVNDAPVLAGADVSVAMGSGTALAQTSADLVLLGESLGPLASGVTTARRTRRVIVQNLTWAAAYNVVALPLAAAGLVQPWMAAIGMSASSVLVVVNALRLSGAREAPSIATRGLPREAGA